MVAPDAVPLVSFSVRRGLTWLIVEAVDEAGAIRRAISELGLQHYLVPDDDVVVVRATDDELRRFAALKSLSRPTGRLRRRDVRGVTGRHHVDPRTGPLFEADQ
jgi:hypothetical protein